MKILIDMNLSPDWVAAFAAENIESVHWSSIGDPHAEDSEIMAWASVNDFVVFTHDLDFGAILALTRAEGPSVVQVRTQNIFPASLSNKLIGVLNQNRSHLEHGCLILIDEDRARVRILPFSDQR